MARRWKVGQSKCIGWSLRMAALPVEHVGSVVKVGQSWNQFVGLMAMTWNECAFALDVVHWSPSGTRCNPQGAALFPSCCLASSTRVAGALYSGHGSYYGGSGSPFLYIAYL